VSNNAAAALFGASEVASLRATISVQVAAALRRQTDQEKT
jgi:hypothetical protein